MIQLFDGFNQAEKPTIVLHNPNKDELYSLSGYAYEIKKTMRFNALAEMTFKFPESIDNNETTITAYDYIKSKRLISINDTEFYIVTNVDEDSEGAVAIKSVTAKSLEAELINKKLTAFGGTYAFYDPISPTGTLLQEILDLVPAWTVGTIDPVLWTKYRTFDISDSTIYGFLINDVSTAYECAFVFDTNLKTISAYSLVGTTVVTTSPPIAMGNVSSTYLTGATITLSHTIANNVNRLLIVNVSTRNFGIVSTAKWGGVNLTRLTSVSQPGGTNKPHSEIWYLKNPGIGTANVVVTLNTLDVCEIGVVDWYNVDQTFTFGTPIAASGTTSPATFNIIGEVGDIFIDSLCYTIATATPDSAQTQVYNRYAANWGNASSTKPGEALTTMSWTLSANGWAYCGVAIKNIDDITTVIPPVSITPTTDIYLSYNNLIKKSTFSEISDEITTCLYVYGGNDLDIRSVNPLGTNTIYDFSYYKTIDWMTSGLISAVTAWENKIISYQTTYADNLSTLRTLNSELIVLQDSLITLNGDYLVLEGTQKSRIQTGLDYSDITILMTAKQAEITDKEGEITSKNLSIASVLADITAINTDLTFSNNFTALQYIELSSFIIENTYQNENIIKLDTMTTVELQDVTQTLYDQALNVLDRVSQPRYEFSMDTANFVMLKEFQTFTNQLQLGSIVTVGIREDYTIETVLLEISMSYDNPTDFSLTFSNRLRLDNGNYQYSDLLGQVVKTGTSVSFNSGKWANWENEYKDDVTIFIEGALNATTNNIINSTNQEIIINQNGLRGRTYIPATGTYDPKQVWLTSSVLAFTQNNWVTSSLALGAITLNGTGYFGLVADAVVGRLIAGNSLNISNTNNNFILDSTGAYLNNAYFSLITDKNKILIDPTNGIKIQTNIGGSYIDKFYADSAGNIIFSGNLSGASGSFSGSVTATSGSFGGWTINTDGISDLSGDNYINSNGYIKLGGLTIEPGYSTFDGVVYATDGSFSGVVSATSGNLGGILIDDKGISDSSGNYLHYDGIKLGGFSVIGGITVLAGQVQADSGYIGGWSISEDGLISGTNHISQYAGGDSDTALGNLSVVKDSGTDWMRFDGDSFTVAATTIDLSGTLIVNGDTGYTGSFTIGGTTFSFNSGILYDVS